MNYFYICRVKMNLLGILLTIKYLKSMRIKDLLLFAAFMVTSGEAMAQTTITAGNAKFVSGNDASLTYFYTNSEAMGGFQLVVSLPDGVTLGENEEKTAKGLSINGGAAAEATFYNVIVPDGFECIGVKADVKGQTSDGTDYNPGDVLLVCFPVKAGATYSATATASKLCTLKLTASDGSANLQNVAIKGFAGSDPQGTGGSEIAAQYAASSASNLSPAKVLKEGDANGDAIIDVADIDKVIEGIGGDYVTNEDADVNADGDIDVSDMDFIIERIA
jgi:hypothetical protein